MRDGLHSQQTRSAARVHRLVRDFMGRHWRRLPLALVALIARTRATGPVVRIGRRLPRVSANTQAEQGQLTTLLNQTFQGARHVKAYGMEEYEKRRAASLFERIYRLIDRATRTR